LGTKKLLFCGPTRIFKVGQKISSLLLLVYRDLKKVSPRVDKSTSEEVSSSDIIGERVNSMEKFRGSREHTLLNSVIKALIVEKRKIERNGP
jgi:hypothetical protein